jgi:hypothetical protein
MPSVVVALFATLLAVALFLLPLRAAFATFVITLLVIPATLPVPNPLTTYLTVTRLLLIVLAVRLVVAVRLGGLPRETLRWTPLHTAFAVFLAATFLAGVALASTTTSWSGTTGEWYDLLDEFLFLVVAIGYVRAIGNFRWVLGVVSVALLVSVGIALVEHATGDSWGHWLFLHQRVAADASHPLEVRAGSVRVRAAAEFALEFGWLTVVLMPALLAWLGSLRRWWLPATLVLLGTVLLAEYWSYSRSALGAFGVVALVMAIASRQRRMMLFAAAGLAIGVGLFTVAHSLQSGYVGLPSGYVDVRSNRLPVIFQLAGAHPLHGLGLSGLSSSGIPTTDTTYLQLYGDTGFLGLVTALAMLVAAAGCALPALRAQVAEIRLAGAAAFAATVAMLASGVATDSIRPLTLARSFWLMAAIGVVASERTVGHLPVLAHRSRRLVIGTVLATELAAWVVVAASPVHFAQQFQFSTLGVRRENQEMQDPFKIGNQLVNTVCGLAASVGREEVRGGRFDCRNPEIAAGVGEMRVQGFTRAEVDTGEQRVNEKVSGAHLYAFRLFPETSVRSGRDTAITWAPFWAPALVLLLLLLVPSTRPNGGHMTHPD